jgi:hypothetical protein
MKKLNSASTKLHQKIMKMPKIDKKKKKKLSLLNFSLKIRTAIKATNNGIVAIITDTTEASQYFKLYVSNKK